MGVAPPIKTSVPAFETVLVIELFVGSASLIGAILPITVYKPPAEKFAVCAKA